MNLAEEKIVFHQTRDIGEVLSTTFRVIRENPKTLLMGTLYFTLPFFVAGSLAMISAFDETLLASEDPGGMSASAALVSVLLLLAGFMLSGLGMVMQITFVNETVKYLAVNPGLPRPGVREIWRTVKTQFWKNILNALVWLILVSMASVMLNVLVLIFIPAIMIGGESVAAGAIAAIIFIFVLMLAMSYLYSISVPIFFISVYEDINIFNAIGRALSLIHSGKDNFWGAIFVNLIALLITFILSFNFMVPLGIIFGVIAYNSGNPEAFLEDEGLVLFAKIGTAAYSLFRAFVLIIPFIAVAIKYFDWVERVDGKGLSDRIRSIGHNRDFDPGMYEETY